MKAAAGERTPTLSARASALSHSPTGATNQLVRAAGPDVVAFTAGESDFDPPPAALAAARDAVLTRGHSRYGSAEGQLELRQAICRDSLARRGVEHDPDQVLVGSGAKQVLFALMQVLLDPGDRVLIAGPVWPSYAEQVRLCGATPVVVRTEWNAEGDRLSPLIGELSREVKLVILCSPANPTGAVYARDELQQLAIAAKRYGSWFICDEVYARFVYDDRSECSLLGVAPEIGDRIIVVDAVSKAFAMPGWRVGWALAPRPVAAACRALQSQAIGHASLVAQTAACAALEHGDGWVSNTRAALQARRDRLAAVLAETLDTDLPPAQGGLYLFPSIAGVAAHCGFDPLDDAGFSKWLLQRWGCAVMPGTAFGGRGHIRLCFGLSDARLELGIERLRQALGSVRGGLSAIRPE